MFVKFKGAQQEVTVDSATLASQLLENVAEQFSLDPETVKILAGGKAISAKTPPSELVYSVLPAVAKDSASVKAMVMGTSSATLAGMHQAEQSWTKEDQRRTLAQSTLARRSRAPVSTEKPLEYTFSEITALPYGDSAGAQRYLERIRDDKAVQALMRKYKLNVGLLTELDPLTNTDTEKRRLGLNVNAGAEIKLRIRTDWYEGFVNYNEILMVLCHELAHNTHGDHDDAFWKVCKLYEKEIKNLDPWKGQGNRLDGM